MCCGRARKCSWTGCHPYSRRDLQSFSFFLGCGRMGKTLCRYVYREIATPFFFALLIFTIILFTVRILKLVELVVNRGVPCEQLLAILLYILPAFFEVTVPMSFLLAILWSVGRFSADREILALKSCGVSFGKWRSRLGHLLLSSSVVHFSSRSMRDRGVTPRYEGSLRSHENSSNRWVEGKNLQ